MLNSGLGAQELNMYLIYLMCPVLFDAIENG